MTDPASPRTAESREYASCERTHATGTTHYHPLRVKTLIDKFEDRRALTPPPPDDERLRAAAQRLITAYRLGHTRATMSDRIADLAQALSAEPGETHEEPR